MREKAEAPRSTSTASSPRGRDGEPRHEAQQRRLPRAVRARDEHEAAAFDVEVDSGEDALLAVPLRETACADHDEHVRQHEEAEHDADHAVHREERRVQPPEIVRRNERMLEREQPRHDGNAEPVQRRRSSPSPTSASRTTVSACSTRAPQNAPRTPKRVANECSPRDGRRRRRTANRRGRSRRSKRDRAAELPRLERKLSRDRDPRADRRETVDGAEPEVAEPREPLQVRVDDEADDRDRPQPAHERGRAGRPRPGTARATPRRRGAPARGSEGPPEARAPRCADCARRAARRSAGSGPSRASGRRPSRR